MYIDVAKEDALGTELEGFLYAMGCEEDLLNEFVRAVHFSDSPAHLITSVPGHHPLDADDDEASTYAGNYGYLKLRSILEAQCGGWDWKDAIVEIQVSSVGGSGIQWYTNFLRSVAPERAAANERDMQDWRKLVESNDDEDFDAQEDGKEEGKSKAINSLSLLRVYYPSERHVSSLSERMQQFRNHLAYWDVSRVVRGSLQQIPSRPNVVDQKPLLWHSKVMTRTLPTACEHRHGWVYLGSHNLSGAAWGNVSKGRDVVKIANYEAGLLFVSPPCSGDSTQKGVADLSKLWKILPYSPSHDGAASTPYAATDRPHLGSAAEVGGISYLISGTLTKWKERIPGRGFGFVRGVPEKAYTEHRKKRDLEKQQEESKRAEEEGREDVAAEPKKDIYQPRRGRGGPVDVFLREDVLLRSGFKGGLVEGTSVTLEAVEQEGRQEVQGWKATWVLSVDESTARRPSQQQQPQASPAASAPWGRDNRNANAATESRSPATTPERGREAQSNK